jgi:DNA ligase (NAD+)
VNSECTSKLSKQVEHFAKTLKIKGLGPATINKLGLCRVADIYALEQDDIEHSLTSEKLALSLKTEIDKSCQVPLNYLLPAFGIPLIGKTATNKLSFICKNITDITKDTCTQAGLGPKATDNLLDWMALTYPTLEGLPLTFQFEQQSVPEITVGYVCISGKLNSYKTKAEATDALKVKGYEVKSTITKIVTILVNESGVESSKTKKARESGLTIITNLKDFIGEI